MSKKSVDGMVFDINREVEYTQRLIGKSALRKKVMHAMREVPRDRFVPEELRDRAFDNSPLPIGNGQTISQPFIVALMTDLLNPSKQDKILEIGTGSGYQTAILSRIVEHVYTVEIVEQLATSAMLRFRELGYTNINVRMGNGSLGWEEFAPYNGIIVTAAAPTIPNALIEQLIIGGRMIIPVGPRGMHQDLVFVEKVEHHKITQKKILGVSFVPFVNVES